MSPGCANCYAETFDKRVHGIGKGHWGPDSERRFFGDKHWAEPLKWNKAAAAAGERHRVFCASMADVFEDHPDVAAARARLYALILDTPNLDWLLLTKRPENVERLWLQARIDAFGKWTDTVTGPLWPDNVWIGTSVENQEQADIRIPILATIPAAVRFLSMEPLLGPVVLPVGLAGFAVDWVIVGGESGPGARVMYPEWPMSLRDQCRALGIAFHFKQWGEWAPKPGTNLMHRVGKAIAGRVLDGRTWDELPSGRRDLAARPARVANS